MLKLLVTFFALLAPTVASAADDDPKQFVLLSYCIAPDVTRFALVSLADFNAVADNIAGHRREFPGAGYLSGVPELRQVLERVPKGSVIAWRGWKPAGTCYPPADIVAAVMASAEARGLKLQIFDRG
jgi:hypothetical protein